MTISQSTEFILPGVCVRTGNAVRMASCVACGQDLGPASGTWKDHAIRREVPLAEAGGAAFDTGFTGVVLRHFYCPSCAVLLDTETATPQDPVLIDRLAGGA